jgi:hypothetical protein
MFILLKFLPFAALEWRAYNGLLQSNVPERVNLVSSYPGVTNQI